MRKIKVVSLRTLLALILILMGMTVGELYELQEVCAQSKRTLTEVHAQREDNQDSKVLSVKTFYMMKNEKLWGDLAEYLGEATVKASKKHKVSLSLLVGVVTVESVAHPFAVSSEGCKGPGQINFKVHQERFPQVKEERDKYDPMKNIDCSAELLKEYTDKYGISGGLQAYNLGETAYRKGRRNSRYVKKVMVSANSFRRF